jgi:hypothetical protein
LRTLRASKKGKACGPFGDCADIWRDLGTSYDSENNTYPFLPTLTKFIDIVLSGELPETIKTPFRSLYFFALHKDPNKPEKLRPIGVPGALRRIVASHVARTYSNKFAKHLLPYNFAVGVEGGMDFIIHSTIVQIDRHVRRAPQSLENGTNLPTRAFVSFDLVNFFNSISRQEVRHIIKQHFPELTPFIDLLYGDDNIAHFLFPNGEWGSYTQEEGFTQGCPLSPILAALVLHTVLERVDKKLRQKAATRLSQGNKGDDGHGSQTNLMAFVDDVGTVIPLEDVADYCKWFQQECKRLGADVNTTKTRILTSTTGISPIPALQITRPDIAESLSQAIAEYSQDDNGNPLEIITGLRYLGFPIGDHTYGSSFLNDQADSIESTSEAVFHHLDDRQTIIQLFAKCVLAKAPHLLPADIYHHADPATDFDDPFNWEGPFTKRITTLTDHTLSKIAAIPDIPTHSKALARQSQKNGGLGLLDPSTTACTAFTTPIALSIRYGTNGITLRGEDTPYVLPPSLRHIFQHWRSSTTRLFTLFRGFGQTTFPFAITPEPDNDLLTQAVFGISPKRLATRIRTYAHDRNFQILFDTAPPDVKMCIPSLRNSGMAQSLMSLPRQDPDFRLANDAFRISLCRKLRCPLWTEQHRPTCPCKQRIDIYGDHIMSCSSCSKSNASNKIRNGLQLIVSKLAPIAKLCYTATDVSIEPTGLIREHPLIRPLDVSWTNHPQAMDEFTTCKYGTTGADIVITAPPPLLRATPEDDLDQVTTHVVCHHQAVERRKYKNRDRIEKTTDPSGTIIKTKIPGHQIIQELNDTNVLLYAFSVDPLGHIGPMARSLLYGDDSIPDPLADNMHPSCRLAHQRATADDSIRGILPLANESWKHTKGDRWFGSTYHHILPSQWAHQIFHLNITHAFATHIQKYSHTGRPANTNSRRRPRTLGQHSTDTHARLSTSRTQHANLHLAPNTMRLVRASNLSSNMAQAI